MQIVVLANVRLNRADMTERLSEMNPARIDPPLDQHQWQRDAGYEPPPQFEAGLAIVYGNCIADVARWGFGGQEIAFIGVQQIHRDVFKLRHGGIGLINPHPVKGRQNKIAIGRYGHVARSHRSVQSDGFQIRAELVEIGS